MAPEAPREQEQSIKARKKELYDAEAPSEGPRRQFSEYVRTIPPAPLPQPLKVGLWCVGGVVVLLFLLALMTIPKPNTRSHLRPRPATPAQR